MGPDPFQRKGIPRNTQLSQADIESIRVAYPIRNRVSRTLNTSENQDINTHIDITYKNIRGLLKNINAKFLESQENEF